MTSAKILRHTTEQNDVHMHQILHLTLWVWINILGYRRHTEARGLRRFLVYLVRIFSSVE